MIMTAAEKQDNCIAGDFVFMYRFDGTWEKAGIEKLGCLGELAYHGDFPRPMFVLRCPGALVKGVEGKSEFRVIFSRDCADAEKENFRIKVAGIAGGI